MKKYVKKPIAVEAYQMTGIIYEDTPQWVVDSLVCGDGNDFIVHTLEGDMIGHIGDYIVKGVRGEAYVCNKDIFEESYKETDDTMNDIDEIEMLKDQVYNLTLYVNELARGDTTIIDLDERHPGLPGYNPDILGE